MNHVVEADFRSPAWELFGSLSTGASEDEIVSAGEICPEGKKDLYREANMNKAAAIATWILKALRERAYGYHEVYLRTGRWFHYEMLIAVDEHAFVSDGFDDIYTMIAGLERAFRSEMFHPVVGFIPVSPAGGDGVNDTLLRADGYIYNLNHSPRAQACCA